MKIWCMSSKTAGGYLNNYICYCEENPADLIYTDKYSDVLSDELANLWDAYGYLYEEDPEEEDWSEEDYDDYYDEQFNTFCDQVSFEADETDEEEAKRFSILIDERVDQ